MKRYYIGGQAVIEGVMMKNKDQYAIAVRKPDQEIEVKVENYVAMGDRSWFFRMPIVRGVVNFIESLVIGTKTLTYSASFYEDEDASEAQDSAAKKAAKKGGDGFLMFVTVAISIILAIGLFILFPAWISEFVRKVIDNNILIALIEGAIRLVIFILYVLGISLMNDMKRVFMYHGAEHKTINCLEAGVPLTPENVKKYSRFHKRCGTSFLFIVMLISILFFMVISVENPLLRMGLRVLLVPAIAGVSYEILRFAGRNDSWIINVISAPGMLVQRLTTREPDLDMIEVAIASVEAVLDWKAYQAELNASKSKVTTEDVEEQVSDSDSLEDYEDDEYEDEYADGYDQADSEEYEQDYDETYDYEDYE